ncbi:MAG: precorrin-4 C(11)-methyltransferase [Clostridia bacterium]|nr:precorrin-4 C(11)-methyltransferase [Clostridia bacterium]
MRDAPGRVYFVGAGPGDLDLLTVRGRRIIGQADVLVYTDSLVNPDIRQLARADAVIHGSAALTLEEIVTIMVEAARRGLTVARVHSGDPSLFGAVLEQMAALERAGVPFEVVPGVSSLAAAAAALKVELTVPEVSQTVIVTRAEGRTPVPEGEKLRDLARHGATVVLFLSAALIEKAVAELLAGGYPPETPAAVVYRASWPDEKVVRGTLADIAARSRAARVRSQALILVGRCLDPALRREGGPRSRLYDPGFGHGFRRARRPSAQEDRATGGTSPA